MNLPIKINKAYLVSCTNSRASDIASAAAVLKGKKVADGVEFYIAAASRRVQEDAEAAGDWQTLIDAGAKTLPAGCGPCIGLGIGNWKRERLEVALPTVTTKNEWFIQKLSPTSLLQLL